MFRQEPTNMTDMAGGFMENVADMKKLTEEIIVSYESRISTVGAVINNAYQALDDFRTNRNEMNVELKDTLSSKGSLRKKDFDNMMKDIVMHQDGKDREIRNLLNAYLEEQKEDAKNIRENFQKNSFARLEDEKTRINNFRKMLNDIRERQTARENEVHGMLDEFRREHKEMAESLRELLGRNKALRSNDLKMMLKNIREKRIEKKEEIRKAASQWRELRCIMAERREASL